MKVVYYSLGIGAIIGPTITILLLSNYTRNYVTLVLLGIFFGILLGWIVGVFIKKKKKLTSNDDELSDDEKKALYKEVVIEIYQEEMNRSVSNYIRNNPEITDDPVLGPIEIVKIMTDKCELIETSIKKENNFNFNEVDIEEINKRVFTKAYKKIFN